MKDVGYLVDSVLIDPGRVALPCAPPLNGLLPPALLPRVEELGMPSVLIDARFECHGQHGPRENAALRISRVKSATTRSLGVGTDTRLARATPLYPLESLIV